MKSLKDYTVQTINEARGYIANAAKNIEDNDSAERAISTWIDDIDNLVGLKPAQLHKIKDWKEYDDKTLNNLSQTLDGMIEFINNQFAEYEDTMGAEGDVAEDVIALFDELGHLTDGTLDAWILGCMNDELYDEDKDSNVGSWIIDISKHWAELFKTFVRKRW